MTITRVIGGELMGFELTEEEMNKAYHEQQDKFDREDVIDLINAYDDYEIDAYYGISRKALMSLVDKIARTMRSYMWKYDMDFISAREEAVEDVVSEYKDSGGIY